MAAMRARAFLSGNSSVGRAQPCQGWGREFESPFPLHKNKKLRFHGASVRKLYGIARKALCSKKCRFSGIRALRSVAQSPVLKI